MKIAIFHELPPGGARRAMNAFAAELKKSNEVDLYSTDEKEEKIERKNFSKIFLYQFIPKPWQGHDWKTRLYKDTLELFELYKLHKKITGIIDVKKYDVVLVSASKYIEAPFIMRFLQTPFVFYCQDPNYRMVYESVGMPKNVDIFRYGYERLNRYVRGILDRQNVSYAKRCLSPSRFIAEKFSRTYKKQNQVVYYGVDTTFFCPVKIKKEYDIFYIGSHDPIDGYDLIEEAVKNMKNKPKMRTLFVEEEWIADDKILRELYRKSKIFLAPARNEGLGACLMEAMACGIPVVAVDEAGHKELVVSGKTGYLVARDGKKLAAIIEKLLNSPNDLTKLGKYARTHMTTEWTWKKQTKQLEKELQQHRLLRS